MRCLASQAKQIAVFLCVLLSSLTASSQTTTSVSLPSITSDTLAKSATIQQSHQVLSTNRQDAIFLSSAKGASSLTEIHQLLTPYISAMLGFVAYLVVTFWFRPIVRFRALRGEIISDLIFFRNVMCDINKILPDERIHIYERANANRRHSAELVALVTNDLPYWYRLYLSIRGIYPAIAAKHLLGLSNNVEGEFVNEHAKEYLIVIQKALGLKHPVV